LVTFTAIFSYYNIVIEENTVPTIAFSGDIEKLHKKLGKNL